MNSSKKNVKLNADHLIKRVLVEKTIDAFEKLFEEIQRNWGHEPDATIQLFKVISYFSKLKMNLGLIRLGTCLL